MYIMVFLNQIKNDAEEYRLMHYIRQCTYV